MVPTRGQTSRRLAPDEAESTVLVLYLDHGFLTNLANLAFRSCWIPREFAISRGTNPTLSAK